jgi:hypothetical protein
VNLRIERVLKPVINARVSWPGHAVVFAPYAKLAIAAYVSFAPDERLVAQR